MTPQQQPHPPRQRARAALATYLRLLAACLEDEADLIENDPERCDDVLKRFREGVLSLSLEEAPLDALMDRMAAEDGKRPQSSAEPTVAVNGSPEARSRPHER